MSALRLQTKFLLSMLVISAGLTATTLAVVGHAIHAQVRNQIRRDLANSVLTFKSFQKQREEMLSRSTGLLADLPTVRALMTTRHAATIQDASRDLWKLSGSDVFVLADSSGKVMALDQSSSGLELASTQAFLAGSLRQKDSGQWWYGGGHLYEVFVRPIFFGNPAENQLLGFLAAGYEINNDIAHEASRIASSQVAFEYAGRVASTTLSEAQAAELATTFAQPAARGAPDSDQVKLGNELFLATSVELSPGNLPPVKLIVVKSFDQETRFLQHLNELLLALGLSAVVGGSLLVYVISNTFTRPLKTLVAGVRALGQGDFDYRLETSGKDEVAEVTAAFAGMRSSLRETQRELLESERLATIGRMASSISHDLRHSLASIVANSEFLCETNLSRGQREELYQEVRIAADRMTDLVESLLEFSRTRESLRPSRVSLRRILERAIQAVKTHPSYQQVSVQVTCDSLCEGWFDAVKLERAFQNLILNSCEAISREPGRIEIRMLPAGDAIDIFIADNGAGIAPAIRPRLFEPFVSFGKENGTGMGLTVVQKIMQDHGGDIGVESTSVEGTVFHLRLPTQPVLEAPMEARHNAE